MKNAMKLILAVAMILSANSLFAQKFGRVNTQEILMVMPETKDMQTNMEAYAKDLQSNLETIGVEFNTKLADYQKNYDTLSDAVRQLKEKELQELQNRRSEFEQVARQDYDKRQNEMLAPIITKAKTAIDKVSQAGAYLVVFDTSTGSLAYFDEANLTDLAPEVKKELGISATAVPATALTPATPATK